MGISFHDRAEVLEQILTDYPYIEVVQLQFNYLDYDDPAVQSRRCYEVCCRHNKPVLVMEPAKGGSLVNLPPDARAVLDGLHGGAPASYALRFVGSFPGIRVVLSGMGSVEQVRGKHRLHEGLPPPGRDGDGRCPPGAGDLPQQESHSLHRLPLLHRRLSQAHLHSGPVRHHEHQADSPRLERPPVL